MAFSGGKNTAFEFIKSYVNRFSTSRMYQTIRVIRPQAQPSVSPSILGDVPNGNLLVFAVIAGVGGSSLFYLMSKPGALSNVMTGNATTSLANSQPVESTEKRKLTAREKRFIKFASVEFDGQIYMTPQDFLESVVEAEPRPRFKRKKLTDSEVKEMMRRMPKLHKNNENFFRGLGSKGIISFSEYLFLLTILIKPQSGFKIAFAMLDQDGSGHIDKGEFKVLENVFSSAARERKTQQIEEAGGEVSEAETEAKDSVAAAVPPKSAFDDTDHRLSRSRDADVDTSLLIYFFGKRGSGELGFEDFKKFMDNLQTEVLQMEYNEFAKGTQTITEMDFARILLRYTFLNTEEYETILDRLAERLHQETTEGHDLSGITFDEFKDFCLFLNNLDDFQIAMKMYTLADKAIAPEEFTRAVAICTGRQLSLHVVKTVFQVKDFFLSVKICNEVFSLSFLTQIFDNDGDGLLSYQEFIAMMKDRVNRGLKTFSRQEGWSGFKRCVKQELRSS